MAMFPLPVLVELLLGGTWTDITQFVRQTDDITITGGRTAAGDTSSPATLTLTLDNRDGRFSPLYSGGAYYPYLQRNTQIRVSLVNATSASGNVYNGYRFTGEVSEWPPRSDPSGNDVYVSITASGPLRRLRKGGGKGSALARYYASLTGAYAPVAYWACEEDPDTQILSAGVDGGTDMNVTTGTPKFKTGSFNGSGPVAMPDKSTWDGLTGSFGTSGDDVFSTPGDHTWVASTPTVDVRAWGGGGGGKAGVEGTAIGGAAGGGGEFAQNTAVAVTPGQSYTVTVGAGGAAGELAGADGTASSFTGDAVTVTANPGIGTGGGRGGGSGSTAPVHHPGGSGANSVSGLHGGGGGGGSGGTSAAGNNGASPTSGAGGAGGAAVAGGGKGGDGGFQTSGHAGGSPGGGGGGGWGSGSNRTSGGNGAPGQVELVYTSTGGGTTPTDNVVRFMMQTPAWGGNNGKVLLRALTSGTVARLDVVFSDAKHLTLKGYNGAGTLLFTGNLSQDISGLTLLVSAELKVSGANVTWRLACVKPGGTADFDSVTGTQATATMGNVTEVIVSPNADITKTAIGHISVQYAFLGLQKVSKALAGHESEMGVDRFVRLANEQALDNAVEYNETADHWGFETGTQGWTGTNAAVAQSGAWSSEGGGIPIPVGAFLNEGGLAAADLNGAVALWNSWTGGMLKTVRIYLAASNFTYTTDLQQAAAAGLKICLTLRPAYNPVSATDLANMTTLLQTLKGAGAAVEVTLWHEPFNSGLTSAQYIAMVQYYGPTVRQYYPLVFCSSAPSLQFNNEGSFYPGDAWVDKIATDLYAFSWLPGGGGTTLDQAAAIADNAVPPKPFGLWEFGSSFGTQFLTGQNANFDGGIGNWAAGSNCGVAAVTTPVRRGTGALRMTASAAGDFNAVQCARTSVNTQGLACSPNDVITGSVWVRANSVARSARLGIDFFDASLNFLTVPTIFGAAVTDSTSGWVKLNVTATAAANAAWCRLAPQVQAAGAAGEIHFADDPYIANTTVHGQTQAQATSFFSYVQAFFTGRLLTGKQNADLLYFDSGTPPDNITAILDDPSDYRLGLLANITNGVGGGHSLQATSSAGGAFSAHSAGGTSGQPVQPGDLVSVSAELFAPSALTQAYVSVKFFNGAGTALTEHKSPATALAAGAEQTLGVTQAADATAAFFSAGFGDDNAADTAGTLLYADNVRVHPQMGPQTRKEYHKFLEEIEDLDQGIMKEAKDLFGLKYRTRIRLINQSPALILDYTQGTVSPPLEPVHDDKLTKNDISVKRHKGSTIRVTATSGAMSIQEPPDGTGRYRKHLKVAANADEQLAALAQHLLTLGTVTGERYPVITVNLARASIAGNALAPLMSAVAGLDIGDRLQVTNLPFFYPSSTADQMIIGYTETISPRGWVISFNATPYAPYVQVSSPRRW